jgi:hypothetical protein
MSVMTFVLLSVRKWGWGCFSAVDSNGRPIWIADAHRDDGKRFVMRADEKLTAFMELELAIRGSNSNRYTSQDARSDSPEDEDLKSVWDSLGDSFH